MSQSSETTNTKEAEPFMLGYAGEAWANTYYTARVAPGIGVTACRLLGRWMLQFFPWNEAQVDKPTGHSRYVNFITVKARTMINEGAALFEQWPYLEVTDDNPLILKCVIEDGIRQIGELNENHQRGAADPAAGTAVE